MRALETLLPNRRRPPLRQLGWMLWLASACTFKVDVDHSSFTCHADGDCGDGYNCIPQAGKDFGACFAAGACTAEVCDGIDNDCDGVIDNAPAQVGDPCTSETPGACGQAVYACRTGALVCDSPLVCGTGTACSADKCIETDCGNDVDDDNNGFTDCQDSACDAKSCNPGGACLCKGGKKTEMDCANGIDDNMNGLTDCADVDDCKGQGCSTADSTKNCGGNITGTGPMICVAPELDCANGIDDDQDTFTDCADLRDCEGKSCNATAGGCTCTAGKKVETNCSDGIDNNGINGIDCLDPDCAGKGCGTGKTCVNGACV